MVTERESKPRTPLAPESMHGKNPFNDKETELIQSWANGGETTFDTAPLRRRIKEKTIDHLDFFEDEYRDTPIPFVVYYMARNNLIDNPHGTEAYEKLTTIESIALSMYAEGKGARVIAERLNRKRGSTDRLLNELVRKMRVPDLNAAVAKRAFMENADRGKPARSSSAVHSPE